MSQWCATIINWRSWEWEAGIDQYLISQSLFLGTAKTCSLNLAIFHPRPESSPS